MGPDSSLTVRTNSGAIVQTVTVTAGTDIGPVSNRSLWVPEPWPFPTITWATTECPRCQDAARILREGR